MKRSPPPPRKKPMPRVNKKRAAKKFERNFHSAEYVKWIQAMPCAVCMNAHYSVAAHLIPRGMGGAKGKASDLVPLCDEGRRVAAGLFGTRTRGCHQLYDTHKLDHHRDRLTALAAKLWTEWNTDDLPFGYPPITPEPSDPMHDALYDDLHYDND